VGGVQSLWKSDIVTGDFKMFHGSFGVVSGSREREIPIGFAVGVRDKDLVFGMDTF
jgi:ribosomal protein L21E